eukprot:5320955-Prorocentrum_lima.AAC.1
MTSSLVGSEMCIRDRSGKSAFPNLSEQWKVFAIGMSYSAQLRWTYLLKPVSYTHLTLPTICSV